MRKTKIICTLGPASINEETIKTPENIGTYTYDDILGKTFKLVNASDYYEYDDQYQVWKDKTDNADYMKKLVEDGENVKIVGIVQSAEDAKASSLTPGINYTSDLVNHVAEQAKSSEIVKQQLAIGQAAGAQQILRHAETLHGGHAAEIAVFVLCMLKGAATGIAQAVSALFHPCAASNAARHKHKIKQSIKHGFPPRFAACRKAPCSARFRGRFPPCGRARPRARSAPPWSWRA